MDYGILFNKLYYKGLKCITRKMNKKKFMKNQYKIYLKWPKWSVFLNNKNYIKF